jgi:hypothetical protein
MKRFTGERFLTRRGILFRLLKIIHCRQLWESATICIWQALYFGPSGGHFSIVAQGKQYAHVYDL